MHLPARHGVVGPAYLQRSGVTPSQLPPQSEPSLEQAWRDPTGAPLIGTHVPSLPGTLQASHCAPHACVQQTPSTQMSEPHSAATLQVAPAPFFL
jgi:hypothetical protein